MDYIINGKQPLRGELPVYGAKNCALALLGATLLTDDEVVLCNCPQIVDVENMLKLLQSIGKSVVRNGDCVRVFGSVTSTDIPTEQAKLLRGSGLILGSAVSRFHRAFLPTTGGCAIGARPIDIHLSGLKAFGVAVTETPKGVECLGHPKGSLFQLRFASVGATENLLCAAVLAQGETTLVGCALEPEVVALEKMLQQMGADISGVGSSVLTIRGVQRVHGTTFNVIPDRIVACTYLSCVAAAGGNLTVTNCVPKHFDAFLQVLKGHFDVKIFDDAVNLQSSFPPKSYGSISTAPYPLFPTDAQQLLLSLCSCADGGTSVVTETLFENRLQHNALQLNEMGANVVVIGNVAKVVGSKLRGATVQATDLRGGAGLVVAALAAEGKSVVQNISHILRGYSNLDEFLRSVGADITVG